MTYEYEDENDPKILTLHREAEVMSREMRRQMLKLVEQGHVITGFVLPERFDVRYIGEGTSGPEDKGTLMGLPVSFGDEEQWGVVVRVDHSYLSGLKSMVEEITNG